MSYQSFEQILQKCHTEGKEFWQVILEDDMAERNVSKQDSMEHMRTTWDAMLLAAATYEGDIKSSSGLVGGDGQRMEEYTHNTGKESLCGEYVDECIAGALQMGESNACMKRIVAAPTAAAVPINARLDSVFVCSLTEEPPWLSMLVFVWQKHIYNNT